MTNPSKPTAARRKPSGVALATVSYFSPIATGGLAPFRYFGLLNSKAGRVATDVFARMELVTLREVGMNIFSVLGLNYEVFHTRMLMWLWTPNGDHGAGDSYLRPFLDLLNVSIENDYRIEAEVKIGASRGAQWRLADILIRTGDTLILVENKVDPGYQDVEQILDEFDGGSEIAQKEKRRFILALIAPGPLSPGMTKALESCTGQFISWNKLIELLDGVSRSSLEPITAELIRQYLDFCKLLKPSRSGSSTSLPPDRTLLHDCSEGVYALIREYRPQETMTAMDVWPRFLERYPDHATALDSRWADSSHYSTKAWFAARLQRMAANGDLIEDTGEWQHTGTDKWGFPKVRVYRRLADN